METSGHNNRRFYYLPDSRYDDTDPATQKVYSVIHIRYAVVIILLLVALLYTCEHTERVATQHADTVKIWRDKYGRSNAEVEVLQSSSKIHAKLADSLQQQLNIKPKTVTKIITISNTITDTVFLSKDRPVVSRWASFSLDSNRLVYSIRDSLALITYRKKYGLLHHKSKYVTRAVSFNPHANITGMTSTEIIPKERRISLGLYAGYGLSVSGGTVRAGWNTGLGVTFRIF
jgi:hypothetical protein